MAGLVKQTALLSVARFANYGLMLISPVILVRLLSVDQFGQYRQFVLYASLLQLIAAFSFAESLLYLIPSHRLSPWRVVAQTNVFVAASSAIVVLLFMLGIPLGIGRMVGDEPWALAGYVVLFVNIDFWEFYFLAVNKPAWVFLYTAGRLAVRMSVVIIAAYVTRNVETIILSLVALEAVRLVAAALCWRLLARGAREPPVPGLMRDQLRFCLPAGAAAVLFLLNRNLGGIAITRSLGPASLAMFTIGTYGDFVYLALGNSIATVLLPAMVRKNSDSSVGGLDLWKKVTIIRCILLMPAALFIARYAHQIVVAGFGVHYVPAVIVMQIHMLFLVRGCFDFSPIVRSVNKTQALVFGSLTAMAINFVLLLALMPRLGIVGAVIALVASSFAEAVTLGWWTTRLFQTSIIRLVPWRGVTKVALAAITAGLTTLTGSWGVGPGLLGVVVAGCVFGLVFFGALVLMRVPEAGEILGKLSPRFVPARLRSGS